MAKRSGNKRQKRLERKARGMRALVAGMSRDIVMLRYLRRITEARADESEHQRELVYDIVQRLTGADLRTRDIVVPEDVPTPIQGEVGEPLCKMLRPSEYPSEGGTARTVPLRAITLAIKRYPTLLRNYVCLRIQRQGAPISFEYAVSDEYLMGNDGLGEGAMLDMTVAIRDGLAECVRKLAGRVREEGVRS